jgi:hypothetical protein
MGTKKNQKSRPREVQRDADSAQDALRRSSGQAGATRDTATAASGHSERSEESQLLSLISCRIYRRTPRHRGRQNVLRRHRLRI